MTQEVPADEVKALAASAGGHKFTLSTVFVLAGARLFFRSGGLWYEET